MGEKTITKAKVLKFFWVTDSFEKNGLKPWTLLLPVSHFGSASRKPRQSSVGGENEVRH